MCCEHWAKCSRECWASVGFRAAVGGKHGYRESHGLELMTLTHVLMCETVLLRHSWPIGSRSNSWNAPKYISRKQVMEDLLHRHSADLAVGWDSHRGDRWVGIDPLKLSLFFCLLVWALRCLTSTASQLSCGNCLGCSWPVTSVK